MVLAESKFVTLELLNLPGSWETLVLLSSWAGWVVVSLMSPVPGIIICSSSWEVNDEGTDALFGGTKLTVPECLKLREPSIYVTFQLYFSNMSYTIIM